MVVIPILALIALDHELFDVLGRVRLLADAVAVKEVLVVVVSLILVVLLVVKQLASLRHAPIPTVAAEVQL